jgi:hypothetical protein
MIKNKNEEKKSREETRIDKRVKWSPRIIPHWATQLEPSCMRLHISSPRICWDSAIYLTTLVSFLIGNPHMKEEVPYESWFVDTAPIRSGWFI